MKMNVTEVETWLHEHLNIDVRPHVEQRVVNLLAQLSHDDVEGYLQYLRVQAQDKRSPAGWVVTVLTDPKMIERYNEEKSSQQSRFVEIKCPVCGNYQVTFRCHRCGYLCNGQPEEQECLADLKKQWKLRQENPAEFERQREDALRPFRELRKRLQSVEKVG